MMFGIQIFLLEIKNIHHLYQSCFNKTGQNFVPISVKIKLFTNTVLYFVYLTAQACLPVEGV